MGGLSRKAYQIKQLRKNSAPVLVVDGGALFFARTPEGLPAAARRNALGIGRAMAMIGTDALGIAPMDLWAGAGFLEELARETHLPLVSLNLFDRTGSKRLFPSHVIKEAGSLRVAIIGVTGNDAPTPGQDKDYRLRDWRDLLPGLLADLAGRADLTVLLSSLSRQDNREIASRFRDLHIIVQAGQGGNNMVPLLINNTLLTQTTGRGKYLGVLRIQWNRSRTWGQGSPDRIRETQSRLDRIDWQIGRMKKRYSAEQLAASNRYQRLVNNRRQLIATLERLKQEQRATVPPCRHRNRFIGLASSLPPDPDIQAVIDQTRQAVNRINRAGRSRISRAAIKGMETLAGWQACQSCHPARTDNYLRGPHSRAYQTLISRDQKYNPECVRCHVTLPSYEPEASADLMADFPVQLQGVGCESCHGPGAAHVRDPDTPALRPGRPTEATCRQCHTPERDPNFDFSQKIGRLGCRAG